MNIFILKENIKYHFDLLSSDLSSKDWENIKETKRKICQKNINDEEIRIKKKEELHQYTYSQKFHYRYHENWKKLTHPILPELPKHIKKKAQFEVMIDKGGLTNVGIIMKDKYPGLQIGTMIAGNSGRAGGACGNFEEADKLHAGHTTQEEDVVSNWLITATIDKKQKIINNKSTIANEIFKKTIYDKWGMLNPTKPDNNTIQGVDYTKADPYMYADAWIVKDVKLSYKDIKQKIFITTNTYPTTLIFVSGPNIGKIKMKNGKKDELSTMNRTWNTKMSSKYNLFKEGVSAALYAGLCAMAENGCTIALLAYVSAGIYGGNYKEQLRKDYKEIVNNVLSKKCLTRDSNKEVELGQYFEKVILTKLEK